jgi:hypothetical protein
MQMGGLACIPKLPNRQLNHPHSSFRSKQKHPDKNILASEYHLISTLQQQRPPKKHPLLISQETAVTPLPLTNAQQSALSVPSLYVLNAAALTKPFAIEHLADDRI